MQVPLQQACPLITSPQEVHHILKSVLDAESAADRDQEHFWVFHLTCRHTVKALHLVSLGTLNSALVHPREVFTRAIADRCVSIVLAHNHPSGDTQPSWEDREITKRLVEAGKLLDIEVVDHVIVAGDAYYSFKQAGTLS